MDSYIVLRNLHCYAYHGVGPQENLVGNDFIIDLKLKVDIGRACETDEVADTVSYADIANAVKAEMSIPSRLLEHAAGRITRRLYREFPQIEAIRLSLQKRNPPMGADIESAGVELNTEREEQTP